MTTHAWQGEPIPAPQTNGPSRSGFRSRPRRIMLATDLSPTSDSATGEALALASDLDAGLVVVSVIEPRKAVTVGPWISRVDQIRARRESAAQALVASGRELGVRVEFLIWEGEAGEAIVEAAGAERADLLVVGSHRRGAVGRFFIGSVSAHVVRHAPCPVLVVREAPGTSAAAV